MSLFLTKTIPSIPRRSHPTAKVGLAAVAVVVAASGLFACSGGDDESAGENNTTTTVSTTTTDSTTTTQSTTTVAPREEADQATKDLATAGSFQTADFGDGWSEFSGTERRTPDEESCNYVEGGGPEDGLLDGAVMNGPTNQLDDQPWYVTSRVYVFPTEDDAIAWVEIATTEGWGNCYLRGFQDAYFPDGEATMRVDTRENEAIGEGGLGAFAVFVGEDSEGQTSAFVTMGVYRLGRTAIVSTIEIGGVEDSFETVQAGEFAALSAAYERVNALG